MEDHIVQIVERVVSCFEKCVMKCYTKDDVLSSFLAVLRYAHRQFNTSNINPIEFWSKILSLADEHIFWKPTTLIIEICLCAPFSNASLERLFSKRNLIETTLRKRLTNDSLNYNQKHYVLILGDCHCKVFMMNILKNMLITGLTQKIVV